MQTIEKALHAPMPFTTGGQTISDRLTAAKHSLAGSQLGKTICKATTEELMAPKKKHLDYLLHCTNEPNVSIPSMANLLIERTQHPSWTVVYKSLITIHNIMCYGNERFSQYLASCNTTFNLGNFLDKNSSSGTRRDTSSYSYNIEHPTDAWFPGYDMSQHVRRYGKYVGEKIATYRVCAFDFCKVKRGREDGLLRTMHTDKLLKTLPILQNQIDALLEFQVSSSELNNGVINCSFILLFRDLIRLFACYNDGIINLLEKYFDMNKKQCRDALDTYKGFLTRLDRVSDFLRVAESVGIDRGEIPDLTRAPASLLEALEAHLIHLEGGRPPPPQFHAAQSQVNNFSMAGGFQSQAPVGEQDRQRYIELEKERLRQFEEQKRQQGATTSQFNPFAADVGGPSIGEPKKTNDDLLDLFNAPSQQQQSMDSTNPFAAFGGPATTAPPPQQSMYPQMGGGGYNPGPVSSIMMSHPPPMSTVPSAFSPDFGKGGLQNGTSHLNGNGLVDPTGGDSNPFLMGASAPPPPMPPPPHPNLAQWQPEFNAPANNHQLPPSTNLPDPSNPFSAGFAPPPETPVYAASSGSDSPIQPPVQQGVVNSQPQPAGLVHQTNEPMPMAQQQRLGIYEQTPFSNMDGSYNAPTGIPHHMMQESAPGSQEQSPAHQGYPSQATFDPFNTGAGSQQKIVGDIDSAMSSMVQNLNISKGAQPTSSVQWGGAPPNRPPIPATSMASMGQQQPQSNMMYGAPNPYGQPGQYGTGQMQPQWGMQQPGMYSMQQQPMQQYGMQPGYGQPMGMPYNMQQMNSQIPQQPGAQPKDPFNPF